MDIGEEILQRLIGIAEELGIFRKVDRNKLDISEKNLPQFVLFDGDEEGEDSDPQRTGGRNSAMLRRVILSPQAFLCGQGLSEEAGTKLRALRSAWLKAVLSDAQLRVLVGDNGYIRYDGSFSSFRIGRQLDGTMLVTVSFGYILNPTAL